MDTTEVKFEEEQDYAARPLSARPKKESLSITKQLVKAKIVKDEKQANYFLGGVVVVCVVLSIFVLVASGAL